MDPLGGVRQSVKVGKLNLVDLAGSERVHITGATGGQRTTGHKIMQRGGRCRSYGVEGPLGSA